MKSKGLELYKHNIEAFAKIENAYNRGENVVGIVHATGTGKSYIALNLALKNNAKRVIYIVPSNGIIEHLENIINEAGLNRKIDYSNTQFRTYQSLINLSEEEIKSLDCDLLVLDEFHHIGAPIWGSRINKIIDTHPNIKIFGMTAYTIRDRNTPYERDMANSDANELFSNKIVSRYDLCDAIIDGILPQNIIYKTAVMNLDEILHKLEEKTDYFSEDENKKELETIKMRIAEAPSIAKVIKESIGSSSKLIYFCPPSSVKGVNDIETIQKEAMEWFKQITKEEDIVFYRTTSTMKDDGKKNREAFYKDEDLDGNNVRNKLRVMFAINQYNEGIHAPNVDGIIMGRGTSSDIVFFEQLGRALAVNRKNSPVIIDLAGNYHYMNELENNIKNRIKQIKINREKTGLTRLRKIPEIYFDIDVLNVDLLEMLKNYYFKITKNWNDYYDYARKYYEVHGNLEVPRKFKTNDGIHHDEDGKIRLGYWITNQRYYCLPGSEREQLLLKIGMRFERKNIPWIDMYGYAQKYYETHGNLEVPFNFKTNDGKHFDEKGIIRLGQWVGTQRTKCFPESEKGIMLKQIGMRFEDRRVSWSEMYGYAKKYYETHGNLEVPQKFKTNDGINYEENGQIKLGKWISKQRLSCLPESEKGKMLQQINMRFNKINDYNAIKDICEKLGVNIEINKSVILKTSLEEFFVKMKLVKDLGLNFTDGAGKLNEIFYMTSEEFIDRFGFSLEQFINLNKNWIEQHIWIEQKNKKIK